MVLNLLFIKMINFMNNSRLRRLAAFLGRALLIIPLVSACSSPGAPPAPPSEVPPAFLTIPNPVIPVPEISSGGGSTAALVGKKGEFSDEISVAPDIIQEIGEIFGNVIGPLQQFQIPVDPSIKHFQGVISAASQNVSQSLTIKMDFADYPFDGKDPGCSGNTATLPVCLRLWVNGERFIAAVFTEFPTQDKPGAGRLRARKAEVLGGGEAGFLAAFNYDHHDPLNRTTEFFAGVPGGENGTNDPNNIVALRRALVTEVGVEGQAEKTVTFSDVFHNSALPNDLHLQYLGDYLQNEDFWSGSLQEDQIVQDLLGLTPVTDQCARISQGDGVDRGTCVDLGIDVQVKQLTFADFPTISDMELPPLSAFPATPTF